MSWTNQGNLKLPVFTYLHVSDEQAHRVWPSDPVLNKSLKTGCSVIPCGCLHTVVVYPLKVLVFATDRPRLLFQVFVSVIKAPQTPFTETFFFLFPLTIKYTQFSNTPQNLLGLLFQQPPSSLVRLKSTKFGEETQTSEQQQGTGSCV